MELLKKALTILGSVLVAALILGVMAPKAVHGLAAALVQVTNTIANPVPVDTGSNARTSFSTQVSCSLAADQCLLTLDTPPVGQTDVVENIMGGCVINHLVTLNNVQLLFASTTTTAVYMPFTQSFTIDNRTTQQNGYTFTQAGTIYVPGGSQLSIQATSNPDQDAAGRIIPASGQCNALVFGYSVKTQ